VIDQEQKHPTAFISYSWDDESHKSWVRELGARLRKDGVDVSLDQWNLRPGDHKARYMETISNHDFILIVCTPGYKGRSVKKTGGVRYEGDIITAELSTTQNQRKFIPILRTGTWEETLPVWLLGKIGVDLLGDPYCEVEYAKLLNTLHGQYPQPPDLGAVPSSQDTVTDLPSKGITSLHTTQTKECDGGTGKNAIDTGASLLSRPLLSKQVYQEATDASGVIETLSPFCPNCLSQDYVLRQIHQMGVIEVRECTKCGQLFVYYPPTPYG